MRCHIAMGSHLGHFFPRHFDTVGDEAFWADTLKLHQAIEGSAFGGVSPGVSPAVAMQAP